jgi:hypothetical protein
MAVMAILHVKSLTKLFPKKIQEVNATHEGESRVQAAKFTHANERYVPDAKKIKQDAPEVFEMLKAGSTTLRAGKTLKSAPNSLPRGEKLNMLAEQC